MGKDKMVKKYLFLSGLALTDNNRGTAALGYGAISFLYKREFLGERQAIIQVSEVGIRGYIKWLVKKLLGRNKKMITIDGHNWEHVSFSYLRVEKNICKRGWPIAKYTQMKRLVNEISCVAAINGGDGFSDIYGSRIFQRRLSGIFFAMNNNIPLVMLPQTIGPFGGQEDYHQARGILKYASHVYVRDECYTSELRKMGVDYELTNDLSFYMRPEPWDIKIDNKNAVGLNVSGLAWDNCFHTLSGQFTAYPKLIKSIIKMFQEKGKTIYLISHSYNYYKPEPNNDDLKAARELYNQIKNKSNVVLIDRDLISPQIKYVISQMSFFIGTRMHSNFAAIFTKVPVFGLSYSYKFKGAFENNRIYNRTANINNINDEDIDTILKSIEKAYQEDVLDKINS